MVREETEASVLVVKLDQVRALGRRRRLRFQIPLGICGLIIGNSALIGGFVGGATLLGGLGMALGPWLLLLCVLPSDPRGILLSLASTASLCLISCIYHAVPLALLGGSCPPKYSARGCTLFIVLDSYAVAILGLHAAYASYIGLGLVGEMTRSRWLPWRPARASLTSAWRCVGSILFWYAPMWLVFGIHELNEPLGDLFIYNYKEADISPPGALRFASAVEMLLLGSLALWPRLRSVAQARLLSMGEGVAAAAAIAELIGSDDTAAVLEHAERTFRTVRCELLRAHHFETNVPAAASFAISVPARLGSCDIFLSHSWHDEAREKWLLLQEWRADFNRVHGREPTIWFDRCCIDPENVASLLPCLPIYLSGCDKLLALRGPTYLSRLWCVVELFVFSEMKADASRIDVFNFSSLAKPPYPHDDEHAILHSDSGCFPLCWGQFEPATRRRSKKDTEAALLFNVQQATCTLQEDTDRLLSAIEVCGGGFDAFNTWMRAIIEKSRQRVRVPVARVTLRNVRTLSRKIFSASVSPADGLSDSGRERSPTAVTRASSSLSEPHGHSDSVSA